MTGGLLLDTHIALWLDSGNTRLLSSTRDLIDRCWQNGGAIYLSAVTAWEVAMLVESGRINLDAPADVWVQRFLGRPGVESVPLSVRAAARSYQMQHLDHRDPADRLLIATAIELGCPLVTYDQRIARFSKERGRQHGFFIGA